MVDRCPLLPGEGIIENPVDYALPPYIDAARKKGCKKTLEGQERHCPLWLVPWVRTFERCS